MDAIESGDVAVVEKMLLRERPSLRLVHRAFLPAAASKGHCQVVQLLICRYPELRLGSTDEEGWTALQRAAYNGHCEVVRVLLEKKRPPSRLSALAHRDSELTERETLVGAVHSQLHQTALHMAAQEGHFKVVELLLSCCSKSILNQGAPESSALVLATSKGHLDVVTLLLSVKADPAGSLAAACAQGHEAIAKLLLEHSPGLVDREGDKAISRAVNRSECRVVQLLVGSHPKLLGPDLLQEAVQAEQWEMALLLTNEYERVYGASALCEVLRQRTGIEGLTVLHRAAQSCHASALLVRLLQFHCLPTDHLENTLLHVAVSQQVGLLLERAPQAVSAVNRKGQTPFDHAVVNTGWAGRKVELLQWQASLDDCLKHAGYAREKVPGHLEALVSRPLLSLLHRDAVGIVCEYITTSFLPS